jgi:arylsulfatase A-like enzyme
MPGSERQATLLLRCDAAGHGSGTAVYWAAHVVTRGMATRPNIVLVSVDCLRADHLGCYGYPRPTSPNIDSLAAEGCVFERCIAQCSWTLPSHTSLLTSLYLRSHGVGKITDALSQEASTLAELLRTDGYLTAAVISGGPLLPRYGLDQGFDVYDASCYSGRQSDVTSPCTHARATEWLGRWGRLAPFFLFLHYWDVHQQYVPPAPYDTLFQPDSRGSWRAGQLNKRVLRGEPVPPEYFQRFVALYDGEIAHTDRYIGALFRELRRLGLAENTLVVLTSDHGDELREHGDLGHGHSLFQELIHVPLIWAEPGGGAAAGNIREWVQAIDIPASILDFAGVAVPAEMEGVSLLPLMDGSDYRPRAAFSEVRTGGGLLAVLWGDSKLIRAKGGRMLDAYDLATDPLEQASLLPGEIRGGARLRELLSTFVAADQGLTLEVRVVGTGPRGSTILSVGGGRFTAVTPRSLEPDDSLSVGDDKQWVVLRPGSVSGDTDGVSLDLRSGSHLLNIRATRHGRPMDPQRVILGLGQHPPDVPFSVQGHDPRLRVAEPPTALSAEEPAVYLWVVDKKRLPTASAELDEELRAELKALGYVE